MLLYMINNFFSKGFIVSNSSFHRNSYNIFDKQSSQQKFEDGFFTSKEIKRIGSVEVKKKAKL